MNHEEEELSEYNSSEIDWGDQSSQGSWQESDGYEEEPYHEETDSEISYGDELERESKHGEADSEIDNGGETNDEEFESEHEESNFSDEEQWSQREEEGVVYSNEEAVYKAPPWPEDGYSASDYDGEPQEEGYESEPSLEDESDYGEENHEPRYIDFSGHSQGPEAYLRWERDMEDWLLANQIPEEEKTTYAEDTLTEDAFKHWERDAYTRLEYDEPAATWEEMKQILSDEFVRDVDNMRQYYSPEDTNPKPRRLILATSSNPKSKQKKACFPKPEDVIQSTFEKKIKAKETPGAKGVRLELNQQVVTRTLSAKPLLEPHNKLNQCKSSNALVVENTICYRCHKKGHFARTCPSRKTEKNSSPKLEKEETREVGGVDEKLKTSNSSIMHLFLPKQIESGEVMNEEKPTQEATQSAEVRQHQSQHDEMSQPNRAKVSDHFLKLITDDPNTLMMHLSFPKDVEKDLGTKEKQPNSISQTEIRGDPTGETKSETGSFTREAIILPKGVHNRAGKSVIASLLIKEEPPDATMHLKPSLYTHDNRGKTLNSKRRMKANLLSLGAGDLVSRSKLLQEGEYDEDIKSSSAQKQGIMRLGEGSMKLRRAKETCEQSSAQMDANTNPFSSTISWRTHSTHLELTSKKNQLKRSSYEEDIEDTTWKIFNEPAGDMRPLIKSFRSNDNESSNESKCLGFSTQRRSQENWVYIKPDSDLEVIEFTNRVNSKLPDLDQQALIGGLRLNQEELSCEPTCYGILVHHRIRESWNQAKIIFGLGVIQFLNQALLDLPYLEAHEFMKLQTYLWRPGDFVLLPEASYTILRCTKPQHIPQIKRNQHLPFLEPLTFKSQRLFPYELGCNIVTYTINQKRPKAPRIFPKLSRYKQSNKFLYLAKIHLLRGQRLVFALISFSLLLFPLELVLEHYISSLLFHL